VPLEIENKINLDNTTDSDLVELAGLHVYLEPREDKVLVVNGKDFLVMDDNFNEEKSGMDAMTVQNVASGEYHVVYMGTNAHGKYGRADLITDIQLLTEATPQQLKDADSYLADMEKEFGEITSVGGNSLGGALANYVGVQNNHVRSVTLNPAMLPAGAVEAGKEYHNITNYISEYDVLNLSQRAIGMGDQVPGAQHTIYNGIPSKDGLGFNHTGYIRDENGQHVPYVTIGTEGEPGYGVIHVDAHSHVVSSIWTGHPLYGGRSERIDLNVDTIRMLSDAIDTSVLERLDLAQTYIGHSVDIIAHESDSYNDRLNTIREVYQGSLESIVEDGLFRGIRFANSVFKQILQGLHLLLNNIETACSSLNSVLDSPPVALIEFITKKTIDVETIFAELRNYLYSLEETVDEFIVAVEDTLLNKIEDVFKAGQEKFHDAVVGELESHFQYVQQNYQHMTTQVDEFGNQVDQVAVAFEKIDKSVASAISHHSGVTEVDKIQSTTDYEMEDSPYLLNYMKFKSLHLDKSMEEFKLGTSLLLIPIVTNLIQKVSLIEAAGKSAVVIINGVKNVHLYGNPGGLVLSLFTNYDDKVKEKVDVALKPLEEMNETVEGVRTGLQKFLTNYPVVVDNLRPYIDSALFNDSGYYNIHIYNSAATSILKDMQLLFDDIVFQLSDHEAEAITVLHDVSSSVKTNMGILEEQIERAATW
jgi:hypothetical protein